MIGLVVKAQGSETRTNVCHHQVPISGALNLAVVIDKKNFRSSISEHSRIRTVTYINLHGQVYLTIHDSPCGNCRLI